MRQTVRKLRQHRQCRVHLCCKKRQKEAADRRISKDSLLFTPRLQSGLCALLRSRRLCSQPRALCSSSFSSCGACCLASQSFLQSCFAFASNAQNESGTFHDSDLGCWPCPHEGFKELVEPAEAFGSRTGQVGFDMAWHILTCFGSLLAEPNDVSQ